jgi:Holliday junction resolvase
MSRIYERELKRILQGDVDTLKVVTKTCSKEEKEDYFKIRNKPFVVIRSAGSLGVDLVALRSNISFPIEVKSSKYKKIRLANTPQLKEQAIKFEKACEKAQLLPIYAFRLKSYRGDSWRIFTLENENLKGIAKRINNRVAKVYKSRDGYYILKWDEGWPLHKFIDYITL